MKFIIRIFFFIYMFSILLSCSTSKHIEWEDVIKASINYQNNDETGDGALFNEAFSDYEIIIPEIIENVCKTIWISPEKVIKVNTINIFVDVYSSPSVAGKTGYAPEVNILFNSGHLRNVYNDRNGLISEVREEIIAILYHELTHVYSPNDILYNEMSGTVEGLADCVVIKNGYKSFFNAARSDDLSWDNGYEKTAYFFEWIDSERCPNCSFVKTMTENLTECTGSEWPSSVIKNITGVSVNNLWQEYQNNWPWPEDEFDGTDDGIYVYKTPSSEIPVGIPASFYCNLYMKDKNKQYLLKLTCNDPSGGNQFAATSVGPLNYSSKKIKLTGVIKQDGENCTGNASEWIIHLQDYNNQGDDLVTLNLNVPVEWE